MTSAIDDDATADTAALRRGGQFMSDARAVTIIGSNGERRFVFVLDNDEGASFYPEGIRFRPLTEGDLLRAGYIREGDKGLFLARIDNTLRRMLTTTPEAVEVVREALAEATEVPPVRRPRTP